MRLAASLRTHRFPLAASFAGLAIAVLAASCGGSGSRTSMDDPCQRDHNSGRAAECDQRLVRSIRPHRATRLAPHPPPRQRPKATERPKAAERPRCQRTTEAVFYAANDWDHLADRLATAGSRCVTYLISIPPEPAADGTWTQPRPGEAERIRALGPDFHALAETRVDAWGPWLDEHPGKTWYDAGVEARRRMRKAGYDVSRGETWALNEFMLPVLTDPEARQEMRDFARGLYEGETPARGLVFSVVPFQDSDDVPEYKTELQSWLEDAPFWKDMEKYVDVWADEVYVDAESCCVTSSELAIRAARLNDYLQHRLALAEAGPASVDAAQRFLTHAYLPLGNAAWQWDFGFGYTQIELEQMERLISDQVFAMRRFSATRTSREAQSRIGFAWAPRDPSGALTLPFLKETEQLLARLSAAIRDSARTGTADDACGQGPVRRWCKCDLPGAQFETVWASFSRWD